MRRVPPKDRFMGRESQEPERIQAENSNATSPRNDNPLVSPLAIPGIEPYYSEPGIAIYNADCRDVLPLMEPGSVDLVLTDPPYGMDYKPLRGSDGSKRFVAGIEGDNGPFDPSLLMRFGRLILFGANWYANALPPSGGWIVWDKTPVRMKRGFISSDAELAWTNLTGRVRKFCLQWGGESHGNEPHYHPTQKPVALMWWLLEQFSGRGDLILDAYMGSGPVLLAAKMLGRQCIGIELEERYCEIAARRLEATPRPLFVEEAPKPEQLALEATLW